ncbi:hypothetical protein ACQPZJ_16535 [Actinoplanes sp. CA-054009]
MFEPPQLPSSGQPGFPPPAEPARTLDRTAAMMLAAFGVVLLLCLGGGSAATVLLLRNPDAEPAAGATSEPAAAPATSEPAPAPTATATVKIIEPPKLGGRSKLRGGDLQASADALRERISSSPDPNVVSAAYGAPGAVGIVLMAATKADIARPQLHVSTTLASMSDGTVGVSGITDAPTGSLGGSATCGDTAVETPSGSRKAAVCAWADEGSIGLVVFYDGSAAAVAGEFSKLRAEIEKKG